MALPHMYIQLSQEGFATTWIEIEGEKSEIESGIAIKHSVAVGLIKRTPYDTPLEITSVSFEQYKGTQMINRITYLGE